MIWQKWLYQSCSEVYERIIQDSIRMIIIGRYIGIDDRKYGECIDSDIRGMHDYREICDCAVDGDMLSISQSRYDDYRPA
ncbi:MAG: hypothetical protein METHSR3v1_1400005 [Methanothrix sp.]|mgnify:CR=1 FL=1|nr:MAG: hypothetical protein METHSR3v1_1400005 [Methanothrix sp.]